MRDIQFLRNNLKAILTWPLIALLLGIALWMLTFHKLQQGEDATRDWAYQRSDSLTSAYVAQLNESLERIRQITLLVKRDWENSGGASGWRNTPGMKSSLPRYSVLPSQMSKAW